MFDQLRADPRWEVGALVTTVNETNDRVAMHGTSAELIHEQAESLGVELTLIGLPETCDNAEYEKRLAEGLAPFRQRGVAHVACGDLFLADIRQWREALFERLDWRPIFPLWQEPTDQLAHRLIADGWALTVTCVDNEKLPVDFLGRRFDRAFLDELPDGVDPCGENGEFHTFVHDGPPFAHPITFTPGRVVVSHGRYAMLDLENKDH